LLNKITNSCNMVLGGGAMNHIRELRLNAKIKTGKESAEMLGISAGMMYQMENGLKKPGYRLAINMSNLYMCSLEDIFYPYVTTGYKDSKVFIERRLNHCESWTDTDSN
jgi:DNA-binding XRE family transcriptional regulator